MDSAELHMADISRALARHDADAAYTLLRERLPEGQAGRALLELIRTVPDWPKTSRRYTSCDRILTSSELNILRHAARGEGIKETARAIPLSPETVKVHRKHIFQKLEATNIMMAVQKGHELHLI